MKKILIIEDDKVLSDMYKIKLEKEGFKVHQAENGLSGLSSLGKCRPDLILLDIMMPGMDGLETLEVLRKQTSHKAKIIILTNVVDKEKIKTVKEFGASDYLIKSEITPASLVRKIKTLLNKKTKSENDFYLEPGKNILKMKNPYIKGASDIEITINIKI